MQKLLLIVGLMLSLGALSSYGGSKKLFQSTVEPVVATSHAPATPILKGIHANPAVQVALKIPVGNKVQRYSTLRCTINKDAISKIERVDVYLTGAEPFSTNNLLTSVLPAATSFDVPVSVALQPGVHFVWLSIVLKNEASIDGRVELRCMAMVDGLGKSIAVKQDNSVYAKRIGSVVRKAGDNNVHTYRIPGVVTTDKGTLLAVYDIRNDKSGDLPGNIDVGLSRSTDSGRTWEPMKVIMDMGAPHENNGVGDPAILVDPVTKKIWVAALWSKGNRSIAGSLPGLSPDTTGQFVVVSSDDDGRTWSVPYSITPQIKHPIWHLFFVGPGSGIAMKDGKLVFAAQYWDESRMPHSTLIYSEDHGKSWKGKIAGPKSNTTESQLVETTPGTLVLNMRDNRGRYRSVATTNNMGDSWSEHATSYSALPDPVCMGSFIKVNVRVQGVLKEVLLFSNPNTSSGRYNITVKASLDLGETWLPAHQLLIDERECYGYSSLTKMDDNTIGLVYEGVRDLYFVKIPVKEIVKQ